ncbi:MAG: PLP-dependent aminotransferase family protein [Nevskia sp.]|nr:PLP-dependent aminotransferase family protein [Nevskia sp.]
MTLYQDLVGEFSGLIEQGVLKPGEKLPSVRALCISRRLSQSTVLQAYHHLEDRGLIEARPRSGYLVGAWWKQLPREPAGARAPRAATAVDVADLVFDVLEATRQRRMVPLGSAFPSPLLFPLPRLAQLLGQVARRLDPWATVTDLPPGSWELRRQIARRYLLAGAQVKVEEIVITSGAMEALNLCLQAVTEPGDIVAVDSPTFYGALQALQRRGLKALEIPSDPRDGVKLDQLERMLERHPVRACWFMNSFQNPLGGCMPEAQRQRLVTLLAARGIPLIEDDVYSELYFGREPPRPAKAYDRAGLVLHCGSFAKCLAPGYRVGWAAPGRYADAVARLKFTASISTNVPAQEAIARYLGEGGFEHHLRRLRQALQAQQNRMLQAIGQHFPAGTRVSRPRGGYFLWLELPATVDALELHRQAAERDISIAPGPMFSSRGQFGHCIRLNSGHPWSGEIEAAIRSLGRLAAAMA